MAQRENLPKDSPKQAFESGEPGETGRSHGQPIDEQGEQAGKTEDAERAAQKPGDHFESGRQQATT